MKDLFKKLPIGELLLVPPLFALATICWQLFPYRCSVAAGIIVMVFLAEKLCAYLQARRARQTCPGIPPRPISRAPYRHPVCPDTGAHIYRSQDSE